KIQGRDITLQVAANVTLPLAKVQGIGLGKPDVPIDARPLVKPAIAEACIHPHDQIILAAIVKEVGKVEAEGCVSVVVPANKVSVQKDQRVAECAVEFNGHAAAAIAVGNFERAAIPPNARLRIFPAER